jgi:putative oxidoreductase
MSLDRRLAWSLLGARLSVFLVFLMWTIDKFVRPSHAVGVFESYYGVGGTDGLIPVLAGLEMLLLVAFVLGLARRFSYGAVLLLHAGSTLSAWAQYFAPFDGPNLLFFAAWPMLAACAALYALRDYDAFTIGGARSVARDAAH